MDKTGKNCNRHKNACLQFAAPRGSILTGVEYANSTISSRKRSCAAARDSNRYPRQQRIEEIRLPGCHMRQSWCNMNPRNRAPVRKGILSALWYIGVDTDCHDYSRREFTQSELRMGRMRLSECCM
jgi:hypothetical protein